ncbi:pseudouridine-5'-phosphate glycosidase [Oceanispirochaeta sp.]|jgi:pseudouridine-5'-phosphate glycosidase|uniref:pseudouridine-5'-phosphate glycosidase n=1 Tax=Oceanispirochaeta sp. TaxID=2035350 RepID=UPI00262C1EF8|nr:pseudouridine-5'-phosphate glycosidase [Oceanispirochaeta sp.]MDA3957317.1 pseudouridine-5'-phosphate glycosidase [Oceanispirochaeta sp.]
MNQSYLDVKEEVAQAIAEGKPVLALESTIISHGMPYPANVETALKVEEIVRQAGVIPATIAIIGGRLKAGLSVDEIEYFGLKGTAIPKASRRDLPYLVSTGSDGATTVASTMIIAALANIPIFATGGIGGVHRGAETSFDISADLQELAHTKVAVICAGAKSILDIPLTLEYLETQGVPVLGYRTEELPAFYTQRSGYKVDYAMESAESIASLMKAKWNMGLQGGIVIANPIPKEYSMNPEVINNVIEKALKDMASLGIKGKKSTPYLLSRIAELSEGSSLHSNVELVFNNVRLASEISQCYYSTP